MQEGCEVYRARDTKLGREVAIKVLQEAFSHDAEKLARFEREAHLLASLNHPNIATLHGLEESGGKQFLVMELVEGETLAERLARGPMLVAEALALFQHIAARLEAAHAKGIVHRDLKPENIKITPDGTPKVLDFGLAKAVTGERAAQDLSQSPTLTRDGTESGVLLGTAPYMSPEQARGKPVDKRTDIWAFGCCLFESLTGKTAFLGETVSDTIARIIEREPDWEALPVTTPPLLRSLLRRKPRRALGSRTFYTLRKQISVGIEACTPMERRWRLTIRETSGPWRSKGLANLVLLCKPPSESSTQHSLHKVDGSHTCPTRRDKQMCTSPRFPMATGGGKSLAMAAAIPYGALGVMKSFFGSGVAS